MNRPAVPLDAINGALARLGERPLASLDEGRLAADLAQAVWGLERDRLLREADWNFARTRATLAADPLVPAARFPHHAPLPADCLRVLSVVGTTEDQWQVLASPEGDGVSRLASGLAAPVVDYTRRVDTIRLWDPMAVTVLEYRLAARLAPGLDRDGMVNDLEMKAARALTAAMRKDSFEDSPTLVTARTPSLAARRW